MRFTPFFKVRALPTLVVGIALFLLACQPRAVVKTPSPEERARALFAEAEQAFQAGDHEKALETYERYLDEAPGGDAAGTALYRIAGIHRIDSRYEEALGLLQRITELYPERPDMPEIRYELVDTLYRLGDYRRSEEEALIWLKVFSGNPLEGEVSLILGKDLFALGDRSGAFSWWLKALESPLQSETNRRDIDERISSLLQKSSPGELARMSGIAQGTPYAPPIYHRLALLHLENNDLDKARVMAMALVRSTPEQSWVSRGREILERITQELSARPGVIGCLLPLSGPFSIYGEEVLNGIQLGMGLFSDSRGTGGLELIIKDTAADPERAVLGVKELGEKGKVMAIIGPLATKPALEAAKAAQKLGIPIITLTQADGITGTGDMVFRNFLTPEKEIKRLLDMSMNEMTMRQFGIFYPDNPYGRFFMNLFWDRVEEMGGSITAVESYNPGETDFADQIKKMVGLYYSRPESVVQSLREIRALEAEERIDFRSYSEEKPEPIVDFEAVFVPDNYQQVALIAPQFPFHSVFNFRFLGTSLWQSPELIEQAGDYIQGAVFPSGFFSGNDSEEIRAFFEGYRENFDSEPGILAATGWDTIRFLDDLMKRNPIRTRRDLKRNLFENAGFEGLTGTIAFDRRGEVIKEPLLLYVSGRRLNIRH